MSALPLGLRRYSIYIAVFEFETEFGIFLVIVNVIFARNLA